MKSFDAILEKVDSSLGWNYHIKVTDALGQEFIEGDNRRVICIINNSTKINCALMPDGTGHWFIFMNQAIRSKLKIQPGDNLTITLEKDTSDYGMEMPAELLELLNQDEEGSSYFHDLTPGKQRSLIYLVLKVKNSNSRLNKSLAILHHLKEFHGKLDFKILMQTIKEYNRL